jgi:hypothetical protein
MNGSSFEDQGKNVLSPSSGREPGPDLGIANSGPGLRPGDGFHPEETS